MKDKTKNKEIYIPPRIEMFQIEFENSVAAGSANFKTGSESSSQTPTERQYESGWSNSRDFDL
ncbi:MULTISPECIES: hypothetical protein [Sphingobacterium]|uniref:hypothetical protein n=1 Tax=Sphingobacterium TaxID=28453 RepID=UPI00257AE66C|nr:MULTISPECIES: hypothetical protein [Sphingobacterium]